MYADVLITHTRMIKKSHFRSFADSMISVFTCQNNILTFYITDILPFSFHAKWLIRIKKKKNRCVCVSLYSYSDRGLHLRAPAVTNAHFKNKF